MTLPKRGDPTALLIISLALISDTLFWAFVLWLPLGGLAGMIYEALQIERAITAAEMATAAMLYVIAAGLSIGAGVLCRLVSRGLLDGSRVAYLFCAMALFVVGFVYFAGGLLLRDQLQGQFGEPVGMGVAWMTISVFVGIIGIGKRTEYGQPTA